MPVLAVSEISTGQPWVKPGDDDHYESRCQHAATDFDEPDSRGLVPGIHVDGRNKSGHDVYEMPRTNYKLYLACFCRESTGINFSVVIAVTPSE